MRKLRLHLDYNEDSEAPPPTHWLRWLISVLGLLVGIASLMATLSTVP